MATQRVFLKHKKSFISPCMLLFFLPLISSQSQIIMLHWKAWHLDLDTGTILVSCLLLVLFHSYHRKDHHRDSNVSIY